MKKKNLLLGLGVAAVAAGFGLTPRSQASMIVTLVPEAPYSGTSLTLSAADAGKTITFDVMATLKDSVGALQPAATSGVGKIALTFQLPGISSGSTVGALGNVQINAISGGNLSGGVFDSAFSTMAPPTGDMNTDGIVDLIGTTATATDNTTSHYFFPAAGSGSAKVLGNTILLGKFDLTVSSSNFFSQVTASGSQTLAINRMGSALLAGTWYENGTGKNPSTGTFTPTNFTINYTKTSTQTDSFKSGTGATDFSALPDKGALQLAGSGGNYWSTPMAVGADKGKVAVNGLSGADATGPLYVALWFQDPTGNAAKITALEGESMGTGVHWIDSTASAADQALKARLNGSWWSGSKGWGRPFDALIKIDNFSGDSMGYDFTGAGVTLAAVAAVPEPATLGLLTVAGLGLMARRRRQA